MGASMAVVKRKNENKWKKSGKEWGIQFSLSV